MTTLARHAWLACWVATARLALVRLATASSSLAAVVPRSAPDAEGRVARDGLRRRDTTISRTTMMIINRPTRAVRQLLPVAGAAVTEAPSIAAALGSGHSGETGSEGPGRAVHGDPWPSAGPIAGLP
jgi:hypothetical protein